MLDQEIMNGLLELVIRSPSLKFPTCEYFNIPLLS